MSVLQPITACFKKPQIEEKTCVSEEKDKIESNAVTEPSLIWKVSSGIYGVGSGAVSYGLGSIKWAATTTYNVGTGVVSATQNVASKVGVLQKSKSKPKNE